MDVISRKTVFVLGAGASRPFGFPTGAQLKSMLCYELQQGSDLMDKLKSCGHEEQDIIRFGQEFQHSGFGSIDRFLASRQEFKDIGRLAIACALTRYQNEPELYRTARTENGSPIPGTSDWYGHLFNVMIDGVHSPDELIKFNAVKFITFNYDLSLERFLFNGIRYGFGLTALTALEVAQQIPIHHVYGHLATDESDRYAYEPTRKPKEYWGIAEKLQVMPDDRPERDEICTTAFAEFDQVFFLGFGYDEMNCLRLGLTEVAALADRSQPPKRFHVIGTALGLTDSQRSMAQGRVGRTARIDPILRDMSCLQLLYEFAHQLR